MRKSLVLAVVLTLTTAFFGGWCHAAIENCDLSFPKDGDIDGWDLSQFIARYASEDYRANVNRDAVINSADVDHFAGFYGGSFTVTARRPNILLIIGDDMGIDTATDLYPGLLEALETTYGAGVWGNPASMPVLTDRLARQGMVFSSAWAQPVCSPTRAAVITGLFADKTNVTSPGSPMSTNHTTFVQLLQNADYSTAMFGKWHLAGSSFQNFPAAKPKQVGFELFRGNLDGYIGSFTGNGFWNYTYHVQDDDTVATSYRTDPTPSKSLPPDIAATTFGPVVKAADAIEWINAQDPDKPWFAWAAFNEAHWPMHVPNADTLDADSLTEVTGCGGIPGTSNLGQCSDKVLVRAMTNAMDTVIGKVLDAVDSLDSDTYVIFIGDNGTEADSIDNMYVTSGRGKGTVYESGARVAMAIRGPGIEAGSQNAEFVHVADLFATILSLAGITPPETNSSTTGATVPSDSESLTPILFGHASTVRNPHMGYILTESSNNVGARNATYKVVCSGGTSNCGFYDLAADPLEVTLLPKPNCASPPNPPWTTDDPEWHYCRLMEIVGTYSIFAP